MNHKKIECIDSGTDFCPCHLAEKGECILCSQLQGKYFCDCKNWNGVCIYQEYIYNKAKAKKSRETFFTKILEKVILEDNLLKLVIKAPHKLVMDLIGPGSFVFVKSDTSNNYFDFPISIENANPDKDTLTIYIEIRGVKTKSILDIDINSDLIIRGPYFNGTFGLENITKTINEKCLIISRGIGLAPSNPVIKKLLSQNNKVNIVNDITPFKKNHFDFFEKDSQINILDANIIDRGELSEDIKKIIIRNLNEGVSFIHCGGADILIYKMIEYLDSINRPDIKLSCCNNSKMCCGEGVCGSCTVRFKGHTVKRLCKIQTDPRSIFEGRRFI
ncbi:MAG: sulfide/dihydroorotate dehydrogenase-like FAD/NAD-binding protein [Sarcina sp.]